MTSRGLKYLLGVAVALAAAFVFLGIQTALADEANGNDISNTVFGQLCENGLPPLFNCNNDTPEEPQNPPVDPCTDIFPEIPGLQCADDSQEPPVDVCPNMDGVQTSTDQCPDNGGGGGGGSLPACSDTLDNDNDGQTDLNDTDCTDASDNDESTASTGGGGGGGGGGGSSGGYLPIETATTTGEVLGATTTTPLPDVACDAFLTAFIKPGGDNDSEQVTRLQSVLKLFEGQEIETTGTYDQPTIAAVHTFQTKYADEILTPWGISQSTGFVYLTTRKKVNEVYCENKVSFPLTDDEQKLITATHSVPKKAQVSAAAAVMVPKMTYEEPGPVSTEKTDADADADTVVNEESPVGGTWSRISDFLKRLLNRAR